MKAIHVRDLAFSYNGFYVLKDVSFEVEEGEFLAILGPNGAGKTTLLRCLSGILAPESGNVEIFGRSLMRYSRNELAKLMGYVPQEVSSGFMTVFDTVLLGRRPYMGLTPGEEDFEKVREVLRLLDLERFAIKRTNQLSGGELQKVVIARALAQDPRILLMDEPTNNLDIKNQLEIMNLARKLAQEGRIVIAVLHDVNLALRFAERFLFMKDGRKVAHGGPEIISERLFREVYGVEVEIGRVRGAPFVFPIS